MRFKCCYEMFNYICIHRNKIVSGKLNSCCYVECKLMNKAQPDMDEFYQKIKNEIKNKSPYNDVIEFELKEIVTDPSDSIIDFNMSEIKIVKDKEFKKKIYNKIKY